MHAKGFVKIWRLRENFPDNFVLRLYEVHDLPVSTNAFLVIYNGA